MKRNNIDTEPTAIGPVFSNLNDILDAHVFFPFFDWMKKLKKETILGIFGERTVGTSVYIFNTFNDRFNFEHFSKRKDYRGFVKVLEHPYG